MAKLSLKHSAPSLNPTCNTFDSIIDCLGKAHALVHVALSEHFSWCDKYIIHEYLSLLEDIIINAKIGIDAVWKETENQKLIKPSTM